MRQFLAKPIYLIGNNFFKSFSRCLFSTKVTPFEASGEKSLYQCEVLIKVPKRNNITLKAVFLDTNPNGSERGTLIALHGAPGSHKDFKYIVPLLDEKNIRVIGINFPGMGYSSQNELLRHNNDEREQFVRQIIDKLEPRNNIVIAGHSRGSVDAIRIAAKLKDNIVGLVPINYVGLRPHRGLRPYWSIKSFAALWKVKSLRFVYRLLLYQFYKHILNMKTTGDIAGVCLTVMSQVDFEGQNQFVKELNASKVKVLNVFSGKDFLVEKEISYEVVNAYDKSDLLVCSTPSAEGDDEIIKQVTQVFQNGQKHLGVCFEKDGHYLQKHRAKFLAHSIDILLGTSAQKIK